MSTLTSCNDDLDIEPLSQVSPEKYLWSEAQLASYVYKYYADYSGYDSESVDKGGMLPSHFGGGLPGTSNGGGELTPYFFDLNTDDVVSKVGHKRYVPGLWKVDANGGFWNFTNIYALNYFLQTVVPRYDEGRLTGSITNIKHHIGEAYFLRAHEYFFRLRRLGDFPIVTTTLPDQQDALTEASKRMPRNEVARFILSDLDKAIELMNNTPPGGKTNLTKNAALLLKARVALFEGTWLKYHAGTASVPNGPGWPGAEKEYNKNYQFSTGSIEAESTYFLTQAMAAAAQVADGTSLTENNKVIQESTAQPENPYYNMFTDKDLQKYDEVIMYRSYNTTLGVSHALMNAFYYGAGRGYTRQFADVFLMQNGLPIYASGSGYRGDDFVEDTKVDRDWRWRLFMKAPGETKAFINIAAPEKFPNAPWVTSSDILRSTATGYVLGKAFSHDFEMHALGRDVTASVVFRAAEAYLTYIEACYEKGGTIDSKADAYWRALRRRAGVDEDYNKTIAATNLSKEAENDWGAYSHGKLVDATLYNIRRERRCEFIGEGYRLNDLLRWRAMDQLNGFQIEGCKIWGPLKDRYETDALLADQADEKRNTVSSPTLSDYLRPYQIIEGNNNHYNGLFFQNAHYLHPIAVQHFLISASDRQTAA
ncbi:MAG: RagB/SusD family nutrient uptake outer membrane protein, partial [Proteiniphilum sp.]|nr:RagB/SusD family nutrient uptake outer membrane protein [Proteiniphilum sp.]